MSKKDQNNQNPNSINTESEFDGNEYFGLPPSTNKNLMPEPEKTKQMENVQEKRKNKRKSKKEKKKPKKQKKQKKTREEKMKEIVIGIQKGKYVLIKKKII